MPDAAKPRAKEKEKEKGATPLEVFVESLRQELRRCGRR
jgi:hypothetical protein